MSLILDPTLAADLADALTYDDDGGFADDVEFLNALDRTYPPTDDEDEL